MLHQDHALYDRYTGPVVDPGEGRCIAETLGPRKAIILQNHGLLTVGGSVDAAAWWLLALDQCCRMQLLAEASGGVVPIEAAQAKRTHAEIGGDLGLDELSAALCTCGRRSP